MLAPDFEHRSPKESRETLPSSLSLRHLFATHPHLLSPVLQVITRAISTFLIKQAGLTQAQAQTGAVTIIQ